ncbi:MAG: fibronectin type III domain-containing protein [Acetobacter sp.]|nr:fibronectin type III domain-containing protein [Bacteroides sp.]MCM1340979.1 fibronectin type III domain-containing protein [Acetobacter sp.]MCM1432465.1 fibronectin type III domain-containing protein [Clostridiales bacterium]
MKKLLSVLMAIIMAFTCLGAGSFTASADEFDDIMKLYSNSPQVKMGDTVSVSINSQSNNYDEQVAILKIIPSSTAFYEFKCDTKPTTGMALSMIMSLDYESEEEIYSGIGEAGLDAQVPEFKVAAKLTKGKTYYFMLSGSECGKYTTNVTVGSHSHEFAEVYTNTAYYEYLTDIKEVLSSDGGKVQPCKYCGYEKAIETYYAPKSASLKYTSTTYNGKKKTPKVTVKDRKGNIIPASNYKVTYKNNYKPGKATVTITFNGKKYDGVMTKTFTIKPKKSTLSSVKSTKSKKITAKWKKDANVTGYQIAYSTSSKFTKKTTKYVTVSKAKTTQKTISKLKGKKKYYVKIRAYKTVDKKKVYGSWSNAKSVTTKK